jgi:hypothetical protein
MNYEIHLKPLAVDVTQNVHEPSLDSATAHSANDVQNANSTR